MRVSGLSRWIRTYSQFEVSKCQCQVDTLPLGRVYFRNTCYDLGRAGEGDGGGFVVPVLEGAVFVLFEGGSSALLLLELVLELPDFLSSGS